MANITEGNRGLLDSLKKTAERCRENENETPSAEITAGSVEEVDINSDTNDSYTKKKDKLIQLINDRKKLEEEGKRSSQEYKEKSEEAKKIQEEIKGEIQKEIEACEKDIKELENSSKNAVMAQIIAANQEKVNELNGLLNAKFTLGFDNGADFHQTQQSGENCGITSLMVAVNMLLGENRFTDNVGEWNSLGSYTEAIGWTGGGDQAQHWIESKGIQDQVEVTSVESVHNTQDLMAHLEAGEVVVASASGAVFKRNDGSKVSLNHYICFYLGTDGNVYANDSSAGADQAGSVYYSAGDLDAFFSAGSNGSITVRAK